MDVQAWNFPFVEFCWYGLLSLASLFCFSSLSYEVRRGLDAAESRDKLDASRVVWATYHVNFAVMLAANIVLILLCVGIGMAEDSVWRTWFAVSILVCGAYWSYTRACERKLIEFLQHDGVYPQPH